MMSKDRRLSAVFEIACILTTQPSLEDMLSRLLSCLIENLDPAETGILLLYDPDLNRLVVHDALGYPQDALSRIQISPGEGVSGKAFQTGQPGLYTTPEQIAQARDDLTSANCALLARATASLPEPQSVICVPLVAGQARVGALVLEDRSRPSHFAAADLPFLQAMAQLIALAIDHVRLQEELQRVQAADQANRSKAELISILAHEMRTPLTSIKGFSTALLMSEITFPPETQHEFLQIIDSECDVLTDLIHNLLESSIIDAGLLKLELEPVILPRLVEQVVNEIARQAAGHQFLVDFPPDFPIIDADAQRVTQVLRNLLDNAVKYSPQGGIIVVRGQVQDRTVLPNTREVAISVADQGVGIAPEHLNRLFEKFFRVESDLGRHVVGSGLGLSIALTIVESHGGRMWAESKPGGGSTFYFALPCPGPEGQADE